MGVEDVRYLSVSREWGKVLFPQPFQMIKTCCSFPSVLQNLQPPAWKTGMLPFTLIFTELSNSSLAWSRGVEMVNGELGNWLLYWRIFWYLHYSSATPLCSLCTWMIRNSCVNWGRLYHGFFNGHARRRYECLLLCHGQSQSETQPRQWLCLKLDLQGGGCWTLKGEPSSSINTNKAHTML